MEPNEMRVKTPLNLLPISATAPVYHIRPDPPLANPRTTFYQQTNEAHKLAVPPSVQRRSRLITHGGAFSFVAPLPIEFPYAFKDEGDNDDPPTIEEIEGRLNDFAPDVNTLDGSVESVYTSKFREKHIAHPTVLSINKRFEEAAGVSTTLPNDTTGQVSANLLAGKSVLAHIEDSEAMGPWCLCYAGHQFGQFAGQLGDGRAISILSTPMTEETRTALHNDIFKSFPQTPIASKYTWPNLEFQLKGAGRTPYSRFADGLAVMRSSVREYLGAEAVAYLGIGTSRSLALVALDELVVQRERRETGAVVTRVAGSWIRIGSFEMQHYRTEWDSLAALARYVGTGVFSTWLHPQIETYKSNALKVIKESLYRNAKMVAGWQAYGFCHGVINTDNVSIMGDTIDYGPYAFMDIFSELHICNHSDDGGRYSYRNQPEMVFYAINKLAESLKPVVGYEMTEGKTAQDDWASEESQISKFTDAGTDYLDGLKEEFKRFFDDEYASLMSKRLGLLSSHPDNVDLINGFLTCLRVAELDYNYAIRKLSSHPLLLGGSTQSPDFDKRQEEFLSTLLGPNPSRLVKEEVVKWNKKYTDALSKELGQLAERKRVMDAVNPAFVLRQWVLEDLISTLHKDRKQGEEDLNLVLEFCQNPFVERNHKYYDVGPQNMLGFQCSCSS